MTDLSPANFSGSSTHPTGRHLAKAAGNGSSARKSSAWGGWACRRSRPVVDRYAAFGYRAIAPAMFDRVERGVELVYDAEGVDQGRALRQKLSWDDSMLDVAAAVAHVSGTGPVAVIGYCYGGSIAWLAAASLPIAAAVGYYGGQVVDFIDRTPQVPTMLHFGALDQAIPLEGVHSVARRHPDVIVHLYDDAGHGFNCDVRASYHPEAAALAEERTREFLALHL